MRKVMFVAMSALFCGLLLFCACGLGPLAGGTSTSENGMIAGVLVDSSGIPQKDAQITLLPSDYNRVRDSASVKSRVDTTNAAGGFAFSNLDTGSYTLQARSLTCGAMALMSNVAVSGDTAIISPCTLKVPGTIRVTPPDLHDSLTVYVYIPGTGIAAYFPSASDTLALDSVPAGTIPALCFGHKESSEAPYALRFNVAVASGDTILVVNTSWQYVRTLYLNTSPSGAAMAGDVSDFPVLVRLNGGMFDFSQAAPKGVDLRFAKPDGTRLPYEIEQWDAAKGKAEIWIRVDTVRGNNENQHIFMYWGNTLAADSSSGAAVFDTAAGFQGVWHLNEGGNDPARDATANRYDGTAHHLSDNSLISGAIGTARVFDGDSSYITMPNTASGKLNFPEDGYFTVSAWVYVDTFDNANTQEYEYHTIVAKGHQQYFLQLTSFPSYRPVWEFSNFRETSKWNMSTSPAIEKQWVMLTGVVQGSLQYLYCNGELVANTTTNYSQNTSRDASDDFTIGRFFKEATIPAIGFCHFKGQIDEVRASSVARNADWIRLSYMNQRSDDKLVQFK
ncbi:MAG: DUF2341 domain-containing protein [Chitinispirillaceae bacterium]|nr:DUF2341 domain-containing protein [Chitinispirillaceae bacterium]